MGDPRIITSRELAKVLIDAGILPPNCRRFVIDSGDPISVVPKVYFECYGDERLIQVLTGPVSVQVFKAAIEVRECTDKPDPETPA